MKRLLIALLLIATAITVVAPPASTAALSGSSFQAGRIIDDGVFFNKNAMTEAQIQDFLNDKVPTCDRWGTQPYAGTTRRAYSEERGIRFPLTCLKDYRENTTTLKNNLSGRPTPSDSKSAARIIYDAAHRYTISPKVLLVLVQKEQGLVTDDWPWPIQYKSATGYGCPDTAPCDAEYYGFFNQVESAAWQFRQYATNPDGFNFAAGEDNYIQWSPNASCGGSVVRIQNQATAGLYNYTPYQPNQAALNNLYGTGNSCSAYGNRNFWRMYNDWFGSTFVPTYSGKTLGTQVYANEAMTAPESTSKMHVGERTYVQLRVKNTGTATWKKDKIRLVTDNATSGLFKDASWISNKYVVRMSQDTVLPNQTATFQFWYKAPNKLQAFANAYKVTVIGKGDAKHTSQVVHTKVVAPVYTASRTSVQAFTSPAMTTAASYRHMQRGQRVYMRLQYKNTGNVTWTQDKLRIIASHLTNNLSPVYDASWLSRVSIAGMQETIVAPGHTATFVFWYHAPNKIGTGNYFFDLRLKQVAMINSGNRYTPTQVTP